MPPTKPRSTPNNPIPTPPQPTIPSTNPSIHSFLIRNNLTPSDFSELSQFITSTHPNETYTLVPSQGFCSLTFSLSSELIIQFRPRNYGLDLSATSLASRVYPRYAPTTRYVTTLPRTGLLVYEMSVVDGISLQDCRVANRELTTSSEFLTKLIVSFAAFQVESYKTRTLPPPQGYKETKVASTLHHRLLSLHAHLPPRFFPLTTRLLQSFEEITSLPWVLTHGDLLPGNIMVERNSGRLTGFVDWGESEYLPFGMGLYGVDEILLLPSEGGDGVGFHPRSGGLRRVGMARELGCLLWFGIAWDGGKIDRVVEEGRDLEEVRKLDAFLFGCGGEVELDNGEVDGGEIEVIGRL
ncbi:hypothetical protein HYALB_00003961 [Hymenoscyphus albidus]|uniref:Aminoglycoside phosphotransferase domain-containing protein n=1 Tax=Hymenoscyphus albidus TaxID=595503 RepID=A0A9N9LVC4_9HELO|nr:hypothetical protein HYALB_00003961 [Hymenoscyphus albidus]